VPDLQSGSCWFESRPELLRTNVYSAFHPSGVGKWVSAIAGKAKAGMAHSDCGWTCGCAGKTVRSLDNTCHTWALLRWWFTTKRRYIKCMHLYLTLCLYNKSATNPQHIWHVKMVRICCGFIVQLVQEIHNNLHNLSLEFNVSQLNTLRGILPMSTSRGLAATVIHTTRTWTHSSRSFTDLQ